MTTPEAIEILEQYNLYRRFKTDKGPSAKDAGLAIDLAIETLKQSKQSKKLIIDLQKQNHNLRVQLSDIKDKGY